MAVCNVIGCCNQKEHCKYNNNDWGYIKQDQCKKLTTLEGIILGNTEGELLTVSLGNILGERLVLGATEGFELGILVVNLASVT